MRELVAVCAVLGGVIEAIAAFGGPELAGVGRLTGELAPAMPTGPLLVGVAVAAISIVGGVLVGAGRSPRPWGIAMIVSSLIGIAFVGPFTGFYTMAAVLTLLAGAMALLVRRRSPRSG